MSEMRLQKFLSIAGVSSRRRAEDIIRQGIVTVNGGVAVIGKKVDPDTDSVKINGKRIRLSSKPPKTFILNKPQGVICTASDPEGRDTIFNLTSLSPTIFRYVGRLDYQSEGALLITSDGALNNHLTHPRFSVPKVYRVKVRGSCTEAKLEKLESGVTLADGKTSPGRAELIKSAEHGSWVRLTIHEGRNRQVRRMVEKVGLRVARLKRESFAGISVAGLRPGQFRELTPLEMEKLKRYH